MNLKRLSNIKKVFPLCILFLFAVFAQVYAGDIREDISFDQDIVAGTVGSLYFVDNESNEIEPPAISFKAVQTSADVETTTADLDTHLEKLRMSNTTGQNSVDISIAPKVETDFEQEARWYHQEEEEDYLIYGSKEEGQMHVDLVGISFETTDGCGDVYTGSAATFSTDTQSIDLLNTIEAAYCQIDMPLKDFNFEQTIPAFQEPGDYNADMVLTLSLGEDIIDYSCYEQQGAYTDPIDQSDQYYFVDEDGENSSGTGCSTPETESEVDEIWEWYDDGEEVYEDEIARDNKSGLLWTESLDCEVFGYGGGDDHWENSKNLCAGLGEDYKVPSNESTSDSDWHFPDREHEWRLPTKNELMQISPAYESHPDSGNDYDHVGHSFGYNCNEEILPEGYSCTDVLGLNEGPGSGHGMYNWNPGFAENVSYDDGSSIWSRNLNADAEQSEAYRVRLFDGRIFSSDRVTGASLGCVRCVAEDRK